MSIKKRMFRSNMKILFAALFSLMFIILLVLILFEDSLESQIYALSQTKLDEHIGEVAALFDEQDIQSAEELQDQIGQWNYQAAVISDGAIQSGSSTDQMKELAEHFDWEDLNGEPAIFSFQQATIAGKYLEEQGAYLLAAHFPRDNWLLSSLNRSFYVFILTVLLAGAAAIAFLMFLASVFTGRMNQVVMEPVELLVQGAQRIKSGNLQENIEYHGEAEFEHVCQAFNDMQSTILADQQQRIKTERARTDMVTGISHDLRTPLTSIRGYIKGILDGVADTEEKKKAYLATACEAAEEMDILLQKLFEFSRIESGQMPFHMVKADLAEYVTVYAAQKGMLIRGEEMEIRLHREKEYFPEISMDVEQVRRILDNLLENSRKYAGVVHVQIDVSIKEEENYLILEWKDNGQGVPKDKLPRIFERFYRCDESRTEKGSGVGLYVVKYIMERHCGMVKAENDSGLKISLYFPKSEEKGREAKQYGKDTDCRG